jgi:hypothetical protein
MNERIAELMRSKGLHKNISEDCQHRMEMLSELIVRECLNVINQPNGVGDDDVIRISDDVKRHFGVES